MFPFLILLTVPTPPLALMRVGWLRPQARTPTAAWHPSQPIPRDDCHNKETTFQKGPAGLGTPNRQDCLVTTSQPGAAGGRGLPDCSPQATVSGQRSKAGPMGHRQAHHRLAGQEGLFLTVWILLTSP